MPINRWLPLSHFEGFTDLSSPEVVLSGCYCFGRDVVTFSHSVFSDSSMFLLVELSLVDKIGGAEA